MTAAGAKSRAISLSGFQCRTLALQDGDTRKDRKLAKTLPVAGRHRLEMGGEWGLLELSGFGRQYVQVYSFLYALESATDNEELNEATARAFRAFPWAGGWSAVDFYDKLRAGVRKDQRPRIVSIEYSSPGYIELGVVVAVALGIRRIVDNVCGSFERIHRTYHEIYKGAQKRKLLKIDVKRKELALDRESLAFAEEATQTLIRIMDIEPESETLLRLTTNDVARMKILLDSLNERDLHS